MDLLVNAGRVAPVHPSPAFSTFHEAASVYMVAATSIAFLLGRALVSQNWKAVETVTLVVLWDKVNVRSLLRV